MRPPTSARSAVVLARRSGLRGSHAARDSADSFAAGRPAQRLQHPRGGRGAVALDLPFARHRKGRRRARTCPDASRWYPARDDDVRVVVDYAHTDDALKNLLETARPLAGGPRDHRLRVRRRSRSHEASADGRRGGAAERPGGRDVGQPALRDPDADHRRDQARHRDAAGSDEGSDRREGDADPTRSPIGGPPSSARFTRHGRAISWWSPARARESTR